MFNKTLLKFGTVGALGIVIDFGITWFLKDVYHMMPLLANTTGFCFAATSNYFLNRRWTFENQSNHLFLQMTKFFSISLAGLIINSILLWMFMNWGIFPFFVNKAFVTGIVFNWNYFLNKAITFNTSK